MKSEILRFDGSKTYRAIGKSDFTEEALLDLKGAKNLKNGRWVILIEDSDWDGAATYDDSFAIYSRSQKLVGITLGFGDGSTGMRVESNRWANMKEGQMSVKASKGSTVRIGGGNERDGEDFRKSVKSDTTSAVE